MIFSRDRLTRRVESRQPSTVTTTDRISRCSVTLGTSRGSRREELSVAPRQAHADDPCRAVSV
jgi:hypothetical protein